MNADILQSSYTVTLPRLVGARQKAQELTAILPENLSKAIVVVDASGSKAMAQGFIDELCKQVLEVRFAPKLIVKSVSEHSKAYFVKSGELRGYSSRILFED